MLTSTAVVPTDAAARYAKQLLAHLGRKAGVEPVEGDPDGRAAALSRRHRHRPAAGRPPAPGGVARRTTSRSRRSRTSSAATSSASAPAAS